MFGLALMAGAAIWDGIAGLLAGFGVPTGPRVARLVENYANATHWPVIIVAGVSVVPGAVFRSHRRVRRATAGRPSCVARRQDQALPLNPRLRSGHAESM